MANRIFSQKLRLSAALFALTLMLAQLLLALSSTANAASATPSTYSSGDTANLDPYGANFFLDQEVEEWKKEKTLQMAHDAGLVWMKQEFPWNEIEFKKGYFYDDKFQKSSWQKFDDFVTLANKYGLQIVARLDRAPDWAKPTGSNPGAPPTKLSDFADFVTAFVQHYKGKIHFLQIWNEPNLAEEWNLGKPVDPAGYVQLLKTAYQAAKKVDPSIQIMSAPMAMTLENLPDQQHLDELVYWQKLYQDGIKPYFDIASANGYGLEYAPDAAPSPNVLNFRRVELLHNIMVQNGDTNKQVWFNEYGWNAPPANFPADKLIWRRVTEQQQADYTVQGIQYARKNWPWAGVFFIWYFRQVGNIPSDQANYYFQMVTPEFEPKPVYNEVKQAATAWQSSHGQTSSNAGPTITVPASTAPAASVALGDTPIPVAAATPVVGSNPATTTTAANGTAAATTSANSTDTSTAATAVSTTVAASTAPGTVVADNNGATMTAASPSNTTTNPDASTSSSGGGSGLIFLIVGVVLVLGAGGGAAYYFLGRPRR